MSYFIFMTGNLELPADHLEAVKSKLIEAERIVEDDGAYFWLNEAGSIIEQGVDSIFVQNTLILPDNFLRNAWPLFDELTDSAEDGDAVAWNSNDQTVKVYYTGMRAQSSGRENLRKLVNGDEVFEDFLTLDPDSFDSKYEGEESFDGHGQFEFLVFEEAAQTLKAGIQ